MGMFLLGVWFVRSGVMEDTAKHLAFFRKLALYGLPVGIGLGLLTASSRCRTRRAIATTAGASRADS